MADIPTYQASESTRTGSTGPTATPEEFGAGIGQGMQQLGAGMEHLARQGARAINRMQQDKQAKQNFDDTRWAGDSYEQEKRVVSEFMANPENNQKESFAGDLDAFVKDRQSQYTPDGAPSPRAYQMFHSSMESYATTAYDHALNVGYRNVINNGVASIGTQVGDAMNTYRNAKGVDAGFATKSLIDSVAHIGNNIETNFRKTAPDLADKMQADLTTQSVLATMNDNPGVAKSILMHNQNIDEQTRKRLNDEITQASQVRNVVEREGFENQRQDHLTAVDQGKSGDKIPLSTYSKYYPDAQAQVQKSRDDAFIDTSNKANAVITDISPLSEQYQSRRLEDMHKGINTAQDAAVYQKVLSAARDNVKLQEQNPVAWLQRYNPTISALMRKVADAPKGQELGPIKSLNDAVLKYQGAPPADVTERERMMYLSKPLADQHLMGTDEAQKTAADLNNSSPKEFIKKMGDVLMRYPGDQHQYIAFNDMVTLPSRGSSLKQEYQLAWQNKDAWWVDTYLGAVAAGKDLNIPDDSKKTVTQRIDNNSTWLSFQSAMIGDNFSRHGEIAGFRDGIQQYAHSLIASGKGPKEAGDQAVQMLIGETLGITKVNGRPMVIARDQKPGSRMGDDEVKDLGRRLGVALSDVPPEDVDQKNFPMLNIMGKDEMHPQRLQAVRDQIQARAFYQTGPDGKSASLYMLDDNGQQFQLRDRKDRPFQVKFSELPDYKFPTTQEWMSEGKMKPSQEYLPESQSRPGVRPYEPHPSNINWHSDFFRINSEN